MLGKSVFDARLGLLTNRAAASLTSLRAGTGPRSKEMSAPSPAAKENATYSRMPRSRERVTWVDGNQSSRHSVVPLRLECTNLPYLTRHVWAAIMRNRSVVAFHTKEEDRVRVSPRE